MPGEVGGKFTVGRHGMIPNAAREMAASCSTGGVLIPVLPPQPKPPAPRSSPMVNTTLCRGPAMKALGPRADERAATPHFRQRRAVKSAVFKGGSELEKPTIGSANGSYFCFPRGEQLAQPFHIGWATGGQVAFLGEIRVEVEQSLGSLRVTSGIDDVFQGALARGFP